MKKFLKLTGMMLFMMASILLTEKTSAQAYVYENWKDYVVNEASDQWENHYDLKDWNNVGYEATKYDAFSLNFINNGGKDVMPSYNLLTPDKKNIQLTAYNFNEDVVWKSYDERVCTVSDTGLVTIGEYSGATVVSVMTKDGKDERYVLVYVNTGKGPEWYDEMFTNAYAGRYKEDLLMKSSVTPDIISNYFKVYTDNYGADIKTLIKAILHEILNDPTLEGGGCTGIVGAFEFYLAPFINIPGERGVSATNPYNGHVTMLAYLDGELYWLENSGLRHIRKEGKNPNISSYESGNIWGFESGYKIVTESITPTGFNVCVANRDDCTDKDNGRKYYPVHTLMFNN